MELAYCKFELVKSMVGWENYNDLFKFFLTVSSYYKTNVDCVFGGHWLYMSPWNEYIIIALPRALICPSGAIIISG